MANCTNSLRSQDPLPVGFRFSPTDEELLNHYLKNKVFGNESLVEYIRQIDVYDYEPWDLPGLLNDHTGVEKLFFFSALDFGNSNGKRTRVTKSGFWKSTGYDREIRARGTNQLIGTKKILVYHHGRARNANRTNWVIHQYRLHTDTPFQNLRSFVVCRLKKKSDVKVAHFDRPNDHATFENAITVNGMQESSPILHCTGQLALSDSQSINVSDYGVNWESAIESYFDPNEFLNLFDSRGQPALPDFQSYSHHKANASFEDDLMDFQPTNGINGEVNNQLVQPGAFESKINLEYSNSLENENNNEVTSRICIDSYDREESSNRLHGFQYDGFRCGTDDVADFLLQRSFVVCRLKKKSDMNVAQFDGPNDLTTFENAITVNGIQESSPISHCRGQPALPDSQSINVSDYGVNWESAIESYFDPNEFLNLLDSRGQPALPDFQSHSHHKASNAYFEDGTSQVCRFPFHSEPKAALMDFQPAYGIDGEVNNHLLQPGASESQINLPEYMNSFPESEIIMK